MPRAGALPLPQLRADRATALTCEHCRCFFCLDDDISPTDTNPRKYCSDTCKKAAQRKRNPKPPDDPCPTPVKIKYENLHRAMHGVEYWNLVALAKRGQGRLDWDHELSRVYPCGDHWHTSRSESRPATGWYLRRDEEVGRREKEKKRLVAEKLARKRHAA